MKPKNTGTILDNYKTWVAFTQDRTVTPEQLLDLLKTPYITGMARAICRHVSCTPDVIRSMKTHDKWFIKSIGLFHMSLPTEERICNAINSLQAHSDPRTARHAMDTLAFNNVPLSELSKIHKPYADELLRYYSRKAMDHIEDVLWAFKMIEW